MGRNVNHFVVKRLANKDDWRFQVYVSRYQQPSLFFLGKVL